MASAEDDPLLTTREFARRMGVTPETVRRWLRKGRLRPRGATPTGQYRFTASQVGELLAAPTERARAIGDHVTVALNRIRMLRKTK